MPRQTAMPNGNGIVVAENNGWRNPLEENETATIGSELFVRLGELEDRTIPHESFEAMCNEVGALRKRVSTLEGILGVFYAEFKTHGSNRSATINRNRAYSWFMRKWEDRRKIRRVKNKVWDEWVATAPEMDM